MKNKQPSFFETEDLPLFSGTSPRSTDSQFNPKPEARQETLFTCPICRDTGYSEWEIQGGIKRIPCICEAGKLFKEQQS